MGLFSSSVEQCQRKVDACTERVNQQKRVIQNVKDEYKRKYDAVDRVVNANKAKERAILRERYNPILAKINSDLDYQKRQLDEAKDELARAKERERKEKAKEKERERKEKEAAKAKQEAEKERERKEKEAAKAKQEAEKERERKAKEAAKAKQDAEKERERKAKEAAKAKQNAEKVPETITNQEEKSVKSKDEKLRAMMDKARNMDPITRAAVMSAYLRAKKDK